MSTQDTPIFLPQESIPGSTEQHASARMEGLTSPQVMATSAAAVSGTVCHDLPLGGLLPKSPHGSPDASISSQILRTVQTYCYPHPEAFSLSHRMYDGLLEPPRRVIETSLPRGGSPWGATRSSSRALSPEHLHRQYPLRGPIPET